MLQKSGNAYHIQGISPQQLVEEFGSPLYVYDADKIKHQFHYLKNAFPGLDVKIKYAAKALTNINILKVLLNEGAGFDAVSIHEVKLALLAGFSAKNIMFTPNFADFKELEEAISLGVQLNIDNLPFLEIIGQNYGSSVPVCLRITPNIQAGGNKNIQVGHEGSKFGISLKQQDEIHTLVKKYNILVNGIHVHTGSDILDAAIFIQGANVVFDFAKNFKDLEFLDFGGGFKVAYYENAPVTNIAEFGEKMSVAFKDFCKNYGKELEIWFEPGKFLVSESGTFLTTATLIKKNPVYEFIGLNTGFNHLIRPMFYSAHHDILNVSNPDGSIKTYNIVGNICETDTFAENREMPETKEGDIIAFKNAGAYGFEMSSNFNSRLKPAEVLIENGKARVIRKRQTFEDLLANQVID